MKNETSHRIEALVDLVAGVCLAVAALVRHSHVPDDTGPTVWLLWTASIVFLVRAGTRWLALVTLEVPDDSRP